MAPFYGPSLVGVVRQLARGAKMVPVGRGLPAAEITRDGDGYVITTLGGGVGFGVVPDHDPIVRTGEQRVEELGELVRCWKDNFGPGFEPGEELEVRFTSDAHAALRTLDIPMSESLAIAKAGRYKVTSFKALVVLATAGVRMNCVP
jgi:hypothetical protein